MTKVLLSLDQRLIERLDAEASARGVTRSALVAELATRGLGVPLGPGARPEVQRALKGLDALPWDRSTEDSTTTIRADRDAR